MRGLLLWVIALAMLGGTVLAQNIPEKVDAAEPVANTHREIIIPHTPTPEQVRPNFDLEGLAVCSESNEAHEEAKIPIFTPEPEEVPAEEVNEAEWVYYGNCRITHYDDCAECCGVAGNATASGVYPTPQHTVATGEDLPFGTELLINGQVYVVEDRGVEPYQVDIYVPDHLQAVEMGMYYTDVYMRGGN